MKFVNLPEYKKITPTNITIFKQENKCDIQLESPQKHQYLDKYNCLGEFTTNAEKEKARQNLGINQINTDINQPNATTNTVWVNNGELYISDGTIWKPVKSNSKTQDIVEENKKVIEQLPENIVSLNKLTQSIINAYILNQLSNISGNIGIIYDDISKVEKHFLVLNTVSVKNAALVVEGNIKNNILQL